LKPLEATVLEKFAVLAITLCVVTRPGIEADVLARLITTSPSRMPMFAGRPPSPHAAKNPTASTSVLLWVDEYAKIRGAPPAALGAPKASSIMIAGLLLL
jgi:hypothetical protein